MAEVLVVADTHLSELTPEARANWDAVVAYAAATRPDLVLHLGDVTRDGADEPAELDLARAQLDRLPVPWRVIPGNHDLGDNPRAEAPDAPLPTSERLERWRGAFDADFWRADLDGWALVAINAQLFDTGGDAEAAQWRWLEATFAALRSDQPAVLAVHKPLTARPDELAEGPGHRYVTPAARARLAALTVERSVPLVLSGHVHQHRTLDLDGRTHVWAPTAWAVLPDDLQPGLGAKVCGCVELRLDPDGTSEHRLATPPGMAQYTLRQDIPSPYAD